MNEKPQPDHRTTPADDGLTDALRQKFQSLHDRHRKITDERDKRNLTHIKAMIEVLKEEPPEHLAQPAGLFISGMLAGLAASVQVLDGGSAEEAMEAVPTRLEAAIGRAFLNGTLPASPPRTDPAEKLQRAENFEGRAAAYQKRASDQADRIDDLTARRNALCEELADQEVETVRQHERAQRAEAAIARVRALHRPVDHRGVLICAECSGYDGLSTDNSPCGYEYCPTLLAIAGPTDSAATEATELETTARGLSALHRSAEDTVTRVITLHEQWVAAGPPPLGASLARWWDARLAELHNAIVPPTEQGAPVGWQAIAEHRERELKAVGEARHKAERERDGAYGERAHLVALLAAMTDGAVIAPAVDVAAPGWQIVYLAIGGRQASWHISPRDAGLFDDVEHVSADDPRAHWDGHSTEDKYARIRQHTRQLARRCGSACAEGHTYTGRCEGAHQVDDSDTTTPDVVHPATEPQASNPQQVDEPCPQHPHAPTFDGVCGGCTQYPADMKPATPASEEQRDAQQ
ncbi:hypothetical protein AB0C80_18325 [Streptomyces anthocyanicus]|uniref:hypothetical protein n=1 Tax=Streptomyces anthocyanicus TaxID=68174 RepID=UPI003405261A